MATATRTKLVTAEEFLEADLGEGTFELVKGEIVEMPQPRPEHGAVCGNSVGMLWNYGRRTGRGYVLSNDTAILTGRDPDTVRGADVAFYTHARWPRAEVGRALPPVPPDLAVEVVSPGNRPGALLGKISEYLKAGVLMVWVVDPARRSVVVYRQSEETPLVLGEGDTLENFPELPEFRCAVAEFFV